MPRQAVFEAGQERRRHPEHPGHRDPELGVLAVDAVYQAGFKFIPHPLRRQDPGAGSTGPGTPGESFSSVSPGKYSRPRACGPAGCEYRLEYGPPTGRSAVLLNAQPDHVPGSADRPTLLRPRRVESSALRETDREMSARLQTHYAAIRDVWRDPFQAPCRVTGEMFRGHELAAWSCGPFFTYVSLGCIEDEQVRSRIQAAYETQFGLLSDDEQREIQTRRHGTSDGATPAADRPHVEEAPRPRLRG